ncbi:MAG: hypothetical protein WCD81_11415, partial [Candidatus Bathyarchaeia archaeon]
ERADEAQRNYNNTIAFSAMTIIPSLITAFTSITKIGPAVTAATDAMSGALDFLAANPIVLVIVVIAALIMGLIWAYENCAPFRNAINEIGSALSGAFMTAVNAVRDALTWLWQNVLAPIGNFIEAVFIADVRNLTEFWNALGATWNYVCSGISSFWDSYVKPVVDFIVGVFVSSLKNLMSVLDDVKGVWDALCSGISSIWNATVGPIIAAITSFADTIHGIFETLFGWIVGGSIWRDLCGGLVSIWNDVIGPLIGIIQGFVSDIEGFFSGLASTLGGIWNGIVGGVQSAVKDTGSAVSTVSSTISSIGSAVTNAARTVASGMGSVASSVGGALNTAGSAISNFIGSICFAHALENAANASKATMSSWVSMIQDTMNKGLESIKNFGTQAGLASGLGAGGAASPISGIAAAGASKAPVINITAPLVQVQGNPHKEDAKYIADLVQQCLKDVIIEPTSGGAQTRKRVRLGYGQ